MDFYFQGIGFGVGGCEAGVVGFGLGNRLGGGVGVSFFWWGGGFGHDLCCAWGCFWIGCGVEL